LVAALRDGGERFRGCPYVDSDPDAQIRKIFDLAQHFDVDVDFHLDFDLDPSGVTWTGLPPDRTAHYHGRVAIGTLEAFGDAAATTQGGHRAAGAGRRRRSPFLPPTDLYLMGAMPPIIRRAD